MLLRIPRALLVLAAAGTRAFRVVIAPGFGNDQIDYITPLKQPAEKGFASALERRGATVSVVDINRADWARVAGGLFDADFYSGTAKPTGGGYGWYVRRLKAAIDEAHAESGERVLVVGHSAGGWLARAALGDGEWADGVRTAERVCGLVTIGAIHRPPADASTCVTRGALSFVDREYPGAFLAREGVGYVSVGGDAIVGDSSREGSTEADAAYAARGEGSASRVAFTSYEAVCGEGGVSGDGVVPLEWTQLDGAAQLRLPGVLHSINEAGTALPTDRWYGSDAIVDLWLDQALKAARVRDAPGGFGPLRWASAAVDGGKLPADGTKLDDFLVLLGRCYAVAGAAHAVDFATANALPAMAGLPPFGALGPVGQALGVAWCALGLAQPLAADRASRTAGVLAYGAYEIALTLAASAAVADGDVQAAAAQLGAAAGVQAVVAFCFWELRRQSIAASEE